MLRWIQVSAATAVAMLAVLPPQWVQRGPNLCLVKIVTGLECYGCGMTRAVSLLLHGDAAGAMAFNRGSTVVLPLLILIALSALFTSKNPAQAAEARSALRLVWIAVSAVAFGLLLTPWIFTPTQIAAVVPRCEWKARYHRECVLCGMTTAFIQIREGRLRQARQANAGALPLYAGALLNEAGIVIFLSKRRKC